MMIRMIAVGLAVFVTALPATVQGQPVAASGSEVIKLWVSPGEAVAQESQTVFGATQYVNFAVQLGRQDVHPPYLLGKDHKMYIPKDVAVWVEDTKKAGPLTIKVANWRLKAVTITVILQW